MGTPAKFLQADIERCIRAARSAGGTVELDPKSGVIRLIPVSKQDLEGQKARSNNPSEGYFAPDGAEDFDNEKN